MSAAQEGCVNVAFTVDRGYLMPLAVSVRSVLENFRGTFLRIWVIEDGFIDRDYDRLLKSWRPYETAVRFLSHESDALAGLPPPLKKYWSPANYLRLLLPEYLGSVDRVLYLDADTVTVDDVSTLYSVDLKGHAVGALTDPHTQTLGGPDGVQGHLESSEFSLPYFNAGVMVLDLVRWRQLRISVEAIAYLRRNSKVQVGMDQEALNAVVRGEFTRIPARWNVMTYWEREAARSGVQNDAYDEVSIRHFEGRRKPWKELDLVNSRGLFQKYFEKTDWASEE